MQVGELWVKISGKTEAFNIAMSKVEGTIKTAAAKAEESSRAILKGVGIAAAAAGTAIGAIGIKSIEATANTQAMNAQFEQVFGTIQNNAQDVVNGLGKDFGMLPNRLKSPFTSMTSMFKGLGYDTKDAMEMAEQGVTIAADAAAFYDKSYEEANAALNSFIKGNYEGGEAIGLFGNETQIAAFAAKELGIDWKNADEAQKQLARMEFAQKMQEAAGATGQAARESDSYQNQLGNLKQGWIDFMAVIGQPLLAPVVAAIKNITEHLTAFKDLIADKGWSGALDEIFPDWLEATITIIAGAITAAMIPALIGLGVAFKGAALNAAAAMIPLLPFIAIGATVAALAYLIIKNWEPLKDFFSKLWTSITDTCKSNFDALAKGWEDFKQTMANLWNDIKTGAEKVWDKLKEFFDRWGKDIILVAVGPAGWAVLLGRKIAENWETIQRTAQDIWEGLKTWLGDTWDGIKTTAGTAWEGVKNAVLSPIETAKNTISDIITDIKNAFANMSITIPKPKLPHVSVDWRSIGVGDAKVKIPDFNLKWYARGTNFHPGGWAVVGEQGPELLNLPRGSQVVPNNKMGTVGGLTIKVENMVVRNDQDISKIARELYQLQQRAARGRGLAAT
ncbi:MAG TPA: hypothetical protein DCZ10_16200 [Pelotomaculum sp.]|jgi:phage-related tail protein|uniref:Uncharacterized protein n=1 Tax=Syntrophomonas wolfei TaxID=863 RepID=A0A354YZ01_9FIRM|nr:hypothetical protein [Pelotomaculum sp.]HBK53941.1 hypothetical protein [Syntrophomonas wolfei]